MPVVPHWVWGVALTLTCGLAIAKGGASERWGAVVFYGAWLLTIAAHATDRVLVTQWAVFGIDVALFVLLTILALTSVRYWPIFMAGFHLLNVLTHVGHLLDAKLPRWAYYTAAQIWGYLMILALLAGVANRWRERRQADAPYPPRPEAQ
ncbi:MAG TPA: hypothetical protein VHN73_03600 [Phenylobacterium sp.]|nr:hypothetical protein [Phenylobacterium sp.]